MTYDEWTEDDRPDCPGCGEAECRCPADVEAPIACAHRIDVDSYCPECAVAGEEALAQLFVRVLKKIEGGE